MYNNSWCSTNVGCLACLHRHGILLPCCAVSLCSIIVMHCQAHSFELDVDTTKFGEFVRGGIVTQHKETKILSFKKLSEALEAPGEFLLSDFSKIERSPMLHVAFQALDAYQAEIDSLPRPGVSEDAEKLLAIFNSLAGKQADKVEVEEGLIRKFASGGCSRRLCC
eukprot:GHRR01026278.1.p1 GENE.GHRR01026278.1~~GHRR01026278.1.p1  ORF type:complete len:166 (-),score=44.70 GHRR01026278.1:478-975(-)